MNPIVEVLLVALAVLAAVAYLAARWARDARRLLDRPPLREGAHGCAGCPGCPSVGDGGGRPSVAGLQLHAPRPGTSRPGAPGERR